MPRDYLAMESPGPDDKVDHGIMGMKWGRRRTDSQIKAAIATQKAKGEPVTPTKKAASVSADGSSSTKPSTGAETSQARYTRIKEQAKSGGASSLDDADLKFFNARTEAMSKVAKLTQEKPGWLKETAKTVLQAAAQRQMQQVTNGIADKYISGPVIDSLKKASEKAT